MKDITPEEKYFLLVTDNKILKRKLALANLKLRAAQELIKRLNKRLKKRLNNKSRKVY